MSDETDAKQGKFHWPSALGSALIVAIVAPLIVSWVQSREPRLVFTTPQVLPFQGPTKNIANYAVTISNEGSSAVESAVCVIRVPNGTIEQKAVTADASIAHSETIEGDHLRIEIPNLNPSEHVQASLLVSSSVNLPGVPEVSLRGKGVTGKLSVQNVESPFMVWLRIFSTASTVVSLALWAFVFIRYAPIFGSLPNIKKRMNQIAEGERETEREQKDLRAMVEGLIQDETLNPRFNLAYFCRTLGLATDADDYLLNRSDPLSYRAEADRFTSLAQTASETGYRDKVIALLQALVDHAVMNDHSRATILFDLALLHRNGSDVELKSRIEKAHSLSPGRIETRLALERSLSSMAWVKDLTAKKQPNVEEKGS
jgi:hypothetical protein